MKRQPVDPQDLRGLRVRKGPKGRADFSTCCAALPAAAALPADSAGAQEAPAPATLAPETSGLTPDEALELLWTGIAEFITDAPYRSADDRAAA